MSYVLEDLGYVEGIYQLETTDDVIGGTSGTSNQQAIELASRTKYLKDRFFDRTSHTLDNISQGTVYKKMSTASVNFVEALINGTLSSNVGIGVVSPTNKLEVNGTIKSNDIILTDMNSSIYQINRDTYLNGIPDDEKSKWTLSYVPSTRIVTITLSSASYYYVKGKRFDISGTINFTAHDNTTGTYFFYFNDNGTPVATSVQWNILEIATVAYVIYNSANNGSTPDGLLLYELHGCSMSAYSHLYHHLTDGTKYISGGSIAGYTLNTSSASAIQWTLDTASIVDEDIFITTPVQGKSNYTLINFDNLNHINWGLYSVPIYISGNGNIQYNLIGTGLVEVTANNTYLNYYVALINANTESRRIITIPGQAIYTTVAGAQAETIANLNISFMPFREIIVLYKITYHYSTGYSTAAGKVRMETDPVKIGLPSSSSIISTISLHSSLSGRDAVASHPATAISTTTTNFLNKLSSTDTTVQSALDTLDNSYYSCGVWTKPTFVSNGDGSANISGTGEYCLCSDTNGNANIKKYSITSPITLVFTNDVNNYVIADYNSGTPILRSTTNVEEINETTIIPVFSVFRSGNNLYTLDWDHLARNLSNKLNQRLVKTQRFVREYGLSLGETTGRVVTLTAGKVWYGAAYILLDAFSSSTNECALYYHSSGSWTSTAVTQYNNTQYDNGTNLATVTNNKYVVNWIYRRISTTNRTLIVLGQGDYTLSEAQASQPPANLPGAFSSQCILVGRIIVMYGATTATQIDSTFLISFAQGAATTDHNSLFNLMGGTTGQYYHLTSTEYTLAQNAVDKRTIDAKGDLIVGTADNTYTKLTVGTNDYVLMADSTQTSGIKWAALPTASTTVTGITRLAADLGTTAGTVVQANDTRMSNARTPTAHASTHLPNGSDAIAAATTDAYGLIKIAADLGTTAGTAVQANDTRLSTSGTWSPILRFGGTSTNMVYSVQTGTWQKTLYGYSLTCIITLSNKGTSTGTASILISTPASSASNASSCIIMPIAGMSGLTAGGSILGYLDGSSQTIYLNSQTATGYSNLTDANFTNTSSIAFNIFYRI